MQHSRNPAIAHTPSSPPSLTDVAAGSRLAPERRARFLAPWAAALDPPHTSRAGATSGASGAFISPAADAASATPRRFRVRTVWQQHGLELTGLTAVVAFALGVAGMWDFEEVAKETNVVARALDAIYGALGLFALNGPTGGDLPWALHVARYLAPAVTTYAGAIALIALFRDRWTRVVVARRSGHVVVCGLGRRGAPIARSFLEDGEHVVVIDSDPDNPHIPACRLLGADVLVGDATDEETIRDARPERAALVFATCDDDSANTSIAVHVFRRAARTEPKSLLARLPGRHPAAAVVRCHAHVADADLRGLMQQHAILNDHRDRFELRLFSVYETSAVLLATTFLAQALPARRGTGAPAHLVIAGLGRMGEAVLLEGARMPHHAEPRRLVATVLDRDSGARLAALRRRHPGLDLACEISDGGSAGEELDAQLFVSRVAAIDTPESPVSAVVICFDDERLAVGCALAIEPSCRSRGIAIAVRVARDDGLGTLLDAKWGGSPGGIFFFGRDEDSSARDVVVDEALEALAETSHETYLEHRRAAATSASAPASGAKTSAPGSAPAPHAAPRPDPSLEPWPRLREDLQESNRAQTRHIPFKLRAAGVRMVPRRNPHAPLFAFDPGQVELLARMEHTRWMQERWIAGWTYAEKKDAAAKRTPYLVGWERLSEEIREYDREPVRRIPAVLAAWGWDLRTDG